MRTTLYFDLGSPYAYLALARHRAVLPEPCELEPILLGAIFRRRGWGSWAHGPERGPRIADIEARAKRYGLPPLTWPATWPGNGLAAMRAATWAKREGAVERFALAAFECQFVCGDDIADLEMLARCARTAGLDGSELPEAVAAPAIKGELRRATEAAWEAGVRGIPSVRVEGAMFFGDDQLEAAAAAAR